MYAYLFFITNDSSKIYLVCTMYIFLHHLNVAQKGKTHFSTNSSLLSFPLFLAPMKTLGLTLFKTEELFLINYPVLLTPDLGCIYHEYS